MKRTRSASPSFAPARIPPLSMFSRTFAALAATLAIATVALPSPQAAEPVKPPVTKRATVTTEHHGIAHTDDYAWLKSGKPEDILEEPETLESPIRAHLDAEGAYARAILGPNRALERRLVAEMRGRLSPRDQSVPEPWGAWEYFTRYPVGSQRKLHYRRPRDGGPEQVLLDENVLARGRRAFSLAEVAVSPDHKLLAYSVDEDGSERTGQGPRSRDRARPPRQHCRGARRRRVVARQPMAVLCRARPVKWGRKSFAIGSARRSRRTSWSTRSWRKASPSRCA